MRVFVIDTRNMGLELEGGMIGVAGSANPSAAEKRECGGRESVGGRGVGDRG
jgi:hypothetical protein